MTYKSEIWQRFRWSIQVASELYSAAFVIGTFPWSRNHDLRGFGTPSDESHTHNAMEDPWSINAGFSNKNSALTPIIKLYDVCRPVMGLGVTMRPHSFFIRNHKFRFYKNSGGADSPSTSAYKEAWGEMENNFVGLNCSGMMKLLPRLLLVVDGNLLSYQVMLSSNLVIISHECATSG